MFLRRPLARNARASCLPAVAYQDAILPPSRGMVWVERVWGGSFAGAISAAQLRASSTCPLWHVRAPTATGMERSEWASCWGSASRHCAIRPFPLSERARNAKITRFAHDAPVEASYGRTGCLDLRRIAFFNGAEAAAKSIAISRWFRRSRSFERRTTNGCAVAHVEARLEDGFSCDPRVEAFEQRHLDQRN